MARTKEQFSMNKSLVVREKSLLPPVNNAEEARQAIEEVAQGLQEAKIRLGLSEPNLPPKYPLVKDYDKFAMRTYVPITVVAVGAFVLVVVGNFTSMGLLVPLSLAALFTLCVPAIDELVSYKGNPKHRVKYFITRLFSKKAKQRLREAHWLEENYKDCLKLYKTIVSQSKEELHRRNVFTVLNAKAENDNENVISINSMDEIVNYYSSSHL